jgi:hypothetical protein
VLERHAVLRSVALAARKHGQEDLLHEVVDAALARPVRGGHTSHHSRVPLTDLAPRRIVPSAPTGEQLGFGALVHWLAVASRSMPP